MWKASWQWANSDTANCHHSWGYGLDKKTAPCYNCTTIPRSTWICLSIISKQHHFSSFTHLSTLPKGYIDFVFTDQGEKHTDKQPWAVWEMRQKEIGFVLQCLIKKIKIPFHLIHCLKSHAESIPHMASKVPWAKRKGFSCQEGWCRTRLCQVQVK